MSRETSHTLRIPVRPILEKVGVGGERRANYEKAQELKQSMRNEDEIEKEKREEMERA